MSVVLLTIPSELDSARRLGFATVTDPGAVPARTRTVVRWGNSRHRPGPAVEWPRVSNPAAAIALNCDKPAALERLARVVATPVLYPPSTTYPRSRTCVVRPVEHTAGREFNVSVAISLPNPRAPAWQVVLGDDHYATEWVATDREVRVWFAGEHCLAASRCPVTAEQAAERYPCRSAWGYRFLRRVPEILTTAVSRARRAIGLDLGAADVLVLRESTGSGRYVFLELNSAPTIDASRVRDFYRATIPALARRVGGGRRGR